MLLVLAEVPQQALVHLPVSVVLLPKVRRAALRLARPMASELQLLLVGQLQHHSVLLPARALRWALALMPRCPAD